MYYKDIKIDFIASDCSSKHVKQVIDEQIAEYGVELQRIKDDVFQLAVSGNSQQARLKAEQGDSYQIAIATLNLLKSKLGLDKE